MCVLNVSVCRINEALKTCCSEFTLVGVSEIKAKKANDYSVL